MVKVAILHEGTAKKTHDNGLIRLLLEKLGLDAEKVEFFGMGSKSNFFKVDHPSYKNLKSYIDEGNINKILFVVDADYVENDVKYGGCENTEKELKEIIEKLGIDSISDTYVTCDNTKCGYLESLILSTIPDERKKCIEDFLACSDFKSKENHKAILHNIYELAYPNAPFDLEHSNFNGLKEKLKNLFQ